MRWSRLFIPTLREAPGGIATIGGRLLTRAGYIRGATHLPLGKRSLDRIAGVIRGELDGQEFSSVSTPIALIARELRSYRQLPQIWYQSPWSGHAAASYHLRNGLEAWSFGLTPADFLERARSILRRCGIECLEAEWIGGKTFVVPCATGEDVVAHAGFYAAELSSAVSTPKPPVVPDPEGGFAPELLHTPNCKTIAELAVFTGLPETSLIKSLVMAHGETLFLALLRGDHQLSELKLETALGIFGLTPASSAQICNYFGASAGSLGPAGVKGIRILADEALRGRRNMISGANRDDYHLRNVTPGKDFLAEFFDLRQAEEGDIHDGQPLRVERAARIGSVSRDVPGGDLHVTDEFGKEVGVQVKCCAISIEGMLWAAAEQHHDADGLVLPPAIAPFDLIVTPVEYSNQAQQRAAGEILDTASAAGLETLLDDREERPGVKFKDADLIGAPWRVTIGKKLEQGIVEVVERRSKQRVDVPLSEAVEFIRTRLRS